MARSTTVPPVGVAGRRVLVTGASRGIGRALALALAREGADVAAVARPSDDLTGVADATGGSAYPCDLGRPDEVDRLIGRVEADGPVDVLINNAGVSNVGYALDLTPAEIDQVLDVDLRAPMHLCRDLLPRMLDRGRGHVVNVSSLAAVMSPPGLAAYAAAKAGLSAYTAGLRQDLRGLPVFLTTVHLGSVPTELDDQSRRYGPLRDAAEDSGGRDITPLSDVVDAIVDAIRTGADQVRLPRAFAPLVALPELPRGLTRLAFRRYAPRPDASPAGGHDNPT